MPRTSIRIWRAAALAIAALAWSPLAAAPEILTADQWRADLDQMAALIRDIHPQPFAHADGDHFEAARSDLAEAIPTLDDHAIMLRMASLAGLLEDGHTRLALPRSHPAMGFSYAHSSDPAPADARLVFRQLPVRLAALDDGLFVGGAVGEHAELAGSRVIAIGGVPADEAIDRASAFASGENPGGHRLLAADGLGLVELAAAIGAEIEACGIPLRLADHDNAERTVCLTPLTDEASAQAAPERLPFRVVPMPEAGLVLFELNMVTAGEDELLPDAFRRAIAEAENADARLVIDLRRNTGGDNSFGAAILAQLIASSELNRFGRTFVVTGPRTFSAAQSLLNALERLTRALFVGEPSGSRPDHFGDSRKFQLDNSGLTLRVSTLHWNSGTGGDPRDATQPHIPVSTTPGDIAGEGDAALRAIAAFEWPGLAPFIADQLRRENLFNASNIGWLDTLTSPPDERLAASEFLRHAERLEAEGDVQAAAYMAFIGTRSHPADETLGAQFERLRALLLGEAQ